MSAQKRIAVVLAVLLIGVGATFLWALPTSSVSLAGPQRAFRRANGRPPEASTSRQSSDDAISRVPVQMGRFITVTSTTGEVLDNAQAMTLGRRMLGSADAR